MTLSASAKQVEEGDPFTLSAVLKSPPKAARVTLQKWYAPSYYGDGHPIGSELQLRERSCDSTNTVAGTLCGHLSDPAEPSVCRADDRHLGIVNRILTNQT